MYSLSTQRRIKQLPHHLWRNKPSLRLALLWIFPQALLNLNFNNDAHLYIYSNMTNSTIHPKNDFAILSYGASVNIASPLGRFNGPLRNMPFGGLQRRLLATVASSTVTTSKKQFSGLHVYLSGVKVGEIRKIEGCWGWRMRSSDALYPSKEEAAIAYVKWAITHKWATSTQGNSLCDRFRGCA